jgi:hypothetical protein
MDARLLRAAAILTAVFCSLGAGYRTQNFIVSAPTPELAREFGDTAERCRRDLAIEWLGRELPAWPAPCPMHVVVGPQVGASGETSFAFAHGQPIDWRMIVRGSRERLIDSVIPHEVSHTIFATHFGRPLPRWADEGACTSIEADEETSKHKKLLIRFLTTGQGIAFNRMFAMTQYPENILPLYSQGYSVARYLIAQGGKQKFVEYIGEGMQTSNWPEATRRHYGFADLSELQVTWLEWVRQGSPPLESAPQLAGANFRRGLAGQVAAGEGVVPVNYLEQADASRSSPAAAEHSSGTGGLEPVAQRSIPLAAVDSGSAAPDGRAESGWYSKLRDAAAAGKAIAADDVTPADVTPAGNVAAAPQRSASPYRPGSISRDTVVHQSLARQQPIGRPGQTVLDHGAGYTAPPRYDWSARPQPSSLR